MGLVACQYYPEGSLGGARCRPQRPGVNCKQINKAVFSSEHNRNCLLRSTTLSAYLESLLEERPSYETNSSLKPQDQVVWRLEKEWRLNVHYRSIEKTFHSSGQSCVPSMKITEDTPVTLPRSYHFHGQSQTF